MAIGGLAEFRHLCGNTSARSPKSCSRWPTIRRTRRKCNRLSPKRPTRSALPARQAVVRSVEDLAQELAYIEALRDRLLNRVKNMADKLNRMARTRHGDGAHLETLTQVRRLTLIALRQISHRFEELDVRTGSDICFAQYRKPTGLHPIQPGLAVPNAAGVACAAGGLGGCRYRPRSWHPASAQSQLSIPGTAIHAGHRMGIGDAARPAQKPTSREMVW